MVTKKRYVAKKKLFVEISYLTPHFCSTVDVFPCFYLNFPYYINVKSRNIYRKLLDILGYFSSFERKFYFLTF